MADAMQPKQRPAHERRNLRTGFTTGACSAAAAAAAVRALLTGQLPVDIEIPLPNGQPVTFILHRAEPTACGYLCSVIKDAGDDPDVTHGAELVAEATLCTAPGIELLGGSGIARVTKPGLGLEVGTAAINPVPQRHIRALLEQELAGSGRGARVILSVPHGEQMAEKTLNARLGLIGGISILGTSGIVRPYSTAAYKASVVQAIDVAANRGLDQVILTTGGKSEHYAMSLHPQLPEDAFIQVGDFIGVGLRHARRRGIPRACIVAMIGKLSKMAAGVMQTHQAGSRVDHALLAETCASIGASEAVVASVREANTARHVLEICRAAGVLALPTRICEQVADAALHHVQGGLHVQVQLVDFDGALLGEHVPQLACSGSSRSAQQLKYRFKQ